MSPSHKPVVWLHGVVASPPFSDAARVEAGYLLRLLQKGVPLSMPHSRPLPVLGVRCHELRINDKHRTWRIFYRVDPDAVLILEVCEKKTQQTPGSVLKACKQRLRDYDAA